MYGKGKGNGHGYGRGINNQAEINDAHLQAASGKIPPTWSPERSRQYSLRTYERDLILWSASSEVDPVRMGPLVALRLGGSAKILAREMDINILAGGMDIPDPNGGQGLVHISGVEFLLRQLQRRYAPLDQETQITAIADVFHFKKFGHESTDELLARFEITINQGEVNGQVQFGEVLKSWMLLNILHIPKAQWPVLLSPTLGALPATQPQYVAFLAYLRRSGHLYEEPRGIQQTFWQADAQSPASDNVQSYPIFPAIQDSGYQAQSAGSYLVADDADEISSGCSHDEEPVDLTECANLDVNTAGELLYLAYRTAKRKFRRFSTQPGRGRKGKGKGKGKSRNFGKPAYYWDDNIQNYVSFDDGNDQSYWADSDQQSYAFQKGAKGPGKGSGIRKGNPIGPDGKQMLCSLCKSPEHFQRFCPQNPKGKGKSSSGYPVIPQPVHWSQSPEAMPGSNTYFAASAHSHTIAFQATIEYDDGTVENLASGADNALRLAAFQQSAVDDMSSFNAVEVPNPPQFSDLTPAQQRMWQFPWWPNIYHTQVRLASGQEGLLVDCGAMADLCGDKWADRVSKLAEAAGQGTKWSKIPNITVEGVGKEADVIDDQATIPICLEDGEISTFQAIVAKNSELPALYGLIRMTQQQAVIDTGNDRIIYPGPGGVKYQLSPGSKVYKLQRALSGHLLMPCAEWQKVQSRAAFAASSSL